MLTAGKGLNGGLAWSRDGRRVAFHSTGRDGVSYDLYIAEPATIRAPRLVFNGFQKNWSVQDWSPDDTKLLINNFVSANESHLFVMDIASAALTPVSEGPEPASVSQARFTADGRGVYLITNRDSEFEQLRRVDLVTGAVETLTGHIPWDIETSRAATTAATSPGSRMSMACSQLTVVNLAQPRRNPAAAAGRPHRPHRIRPRRQAPRVLAREPAVAARRVRARARAQLHRALHAERGGPDRSAAVRARRAGALSDLRSRQRRATAQFRRSSTDRATRRARTRCSSTSTADRNRRRCPASARSRSSWCARWASW